MSFFMSISLKVKEGKENDFTEQIKTWSLGAKSTLEKGLEPTGN